MLYKLLCIFLFLLIYINPVKAQDSTAERIAGKVRTYTTTRLTTEPPVIDGNLNDLCWQVTGTWAGDYTQWIPKEGAKPTYPTHLKILYNDSKIYVAIRAFDDPALIIQKLGRRDEFNGDAVGLNFDSYHDHRTGFEFNVTSAGQKIDLLLYNPMTADFNWNAVWNAKVAVEDSAWTAEFEIPLSQLRYSSDSLQVWGLHSWRWIDRLQEESDWEPQSSTGPGMLFQFGELHGISNLPSSRRIEIVPYSLGKLNTFKSEDANPFASEGRSWWGNAGFDVKVGLASNFTADLTINPDFGQVESDPSVMNLTAFETYYEEKRPFFLEGKNIFAFEFDDNSLFYSRRIGHTPGYVPPISNNAYIDYPENTTIISAVKLSGKTANGLAVGFLQSLTASEFAEVHQQGNSKDVAVEPFTSYTIARLQQDFEEGNTVLGGILTSTNRIINDSHLEYMTRNAFTGGLDFLHHWNDKEFFVDAKITGSHVNGTPEAMALLQYSSARFYQRPDADHIEFDETRTTLSGHGGEIKIGKGSKGFWRYSAGLNWRSPGLELNDLGYMQTADIFNQEAEVSYFVNQPVGIFRTYTIAAEQSNYWDYGMNYLASSAETRFYCEFLNNWAIHLNFEYTTEALDTRLLRGGPAMLLPSEWSNYFHLRTDPSEKIFFELATNFTVSKEERLRYYSIEPSLSIMPSNNLKLSTGVNYSYNNDDLQFIGSYPSGDEHQYLLGEINQRTLGITFRIDYNITPEFSIQYYGSPFASVGRYSDYKLVTNPQAENYEGRFVKFNPSSENNDILISTSNNISFPNPDFNFSQFRSNLVLRWEYMPGSQIYFVWSNERTHYVQPGKKSVTDEISRLQDVYPSSIFLLKVNYWFTI